MNEILATAEVKVNNVTVIIPVWERENPFSPAE